MIQHHITLHFTLQGPILTQGVGGLSHGLDSAVLRDHKGNPVLAGTLIKGNLRHGIQELQHISENQFVDATWLTEWFGEASADATHNAPQRGRLVFDHHWQTNHVAEVSGQINRIKINEQGTVEKGSLAFIESPFLPGQLITFKGNITVNASQQEVDALTNVLNKAAQYLFAIGGLKSIGFGKVVKVDITTGAISVNKVKVKASQRVDYRLKFDRPVCFPAYSSVGNRFESQKFASGAVVKGVIAQLVKPKTLLAENLDVINFSFLYPYNNEGRTPPLPLSKAVNKLGGKVDTAQHACFDSANANLETPYMVWASDWKNEAEDVYGYTKLPTTLMVRTGIEQYSEYAPHLRGSAQESNLFSLECVLHETGTTKEGSPIEWGGEISFTRVPKDKRERVAKELIDILSSPCIGPFGKTKAMATFTDVSKGVDEYFRFKKNEERAVILTLRSPAALHPYQGEAPMPCDDITAHYQQVFNLLADNSLQLISAYVQHTLSGGDYMWRRYGQPAPYQPQILTAPGSVFIFQVNKLQAAQSVINQWIKNGMPSHPEQNGNDTTPEGIQENWQQNPYNRGNGYGEVTAELRTGEAQ
ncbi:RAMP superfamily CRISPR-associated protein [Paraglaciecola sp. 20A4]|uniref:RAMP superfamily CRISPR-associated protein n=1 Tax=Paraglaciecola sp. 20A4 TaxID=2687288 RepID=UPI0014095F7D|nr:RAMP superfamily CRISPR-associated protein [Paraglaciecola sp. 20A4]